MRLETRYPKEGEKVVIETKSGVVFRGIFRGLRVITPRRGRCYIIDNPEKLYGEGWVAFGVDNKWIKTRHVKRLGVVDEEYI